MTYRSTNPRTTYRSSLNGARRPHYAQARTWYRFAKRLRSAAARSTCPSFNPHLLKEEALAQSLRLRARGFVLNTALELTPEAESGLRKLEHWTGHQGARFPELVARITVTDPDDPTADEVHLFLEERDRTSSRGRKSFVGRLPAAHALWVAPLLRLETDAYGTGPVLRFYVTGNSVRLTRPGLDTGASGVEVAIAEAHEAARAWIDWADDRRTWADAHAVAEASPYAYRASYLDGLLYGTDHFGPSSYELNGHEEADEAGW
jgi:hypothetical protein